MDDADVLLEAEAADRNAEDRGDEVASGDLSEVQIPRAVPPPPQPSKDEVSRHNLTHLNYRSWCPHCVAGRRNNTGHRLSHSSQRRVPLFCADYCFIRDVEDDDNLPVLVG